MSVPIVGIVGAGQLARMLYQAAIPLAIPIRLLAASETDSAARVAHDAATGAPDSIEALRGFAATCDVVTFETELVEPDQLHALEAAGVVLRPSAATLTVAVDKREQRAAMRRVGAPVPLHQEARTMRAVTEFAASSGWPVVLKTTRGGYDGRGVWIVGDEDEARAVVEGLTGRPLLVEEYCDIDAEFAVQVARRPGGEMVIYPAVDTVQRDGVFRESLAPSSLDASRTSHAARIATAIASEIDCVGMMAVEFFVAGGRLLTNELAVRPHNTAHYTIEGCVTSQFENHLRAVCDLPLGSTALTAPAVATVNVIGPDDGSDPATSLAGMLGVESAHVHLYGKAARPGRKLGHVTVCADSGDEAMARARSAAERVATGARGGGR
ncbi:MAG: 5-(carboxyamino)imidazole ribonucleotide synthase [Dehalococcoidia bacterium]|nr:5-(carboxyamino)imidazole ribonucleotide synthase [Dehalococcoidia bacterium]